jgi:C4-dicarboxylate-specific signal transduction histidine kinase
VVYGQVARWLVHDLRNPTQALTLVSELLNEAYGPDDEPPERTIREAATHLVRSLETLDRLLRITGRSAEQGPVSLGDALRFLDTLHHVHRSPITLDLSAALPESLPAVVAIEDHLEHALLNVYMNALEACEDRTDGRIGVTAAMADGRVVLDVVDNGRGVARELAGRLFEPFTTTKTVRPMAGLGLAVARDLLGRTGGTVEWDAGRTAGARFVVTLQCWH